jgi:hypothetical protein
LTFDRSWERHLECRNLVGRCDRDRINAGRRRSSARHYETGGLIGKKHDSGLLKAITTSDGNPRRT